MGSDAAIVNVPAPAAANDAGKKKKKNNRSARLKQCKLDARREQWLSQVKNKNCKVADESALPSLPCSMPRPRVTDQVAGSWENDLKIRPKEEIDNIQEDFQGSDSESFFSSPTSSSSGTNYMMKTHSSSYHSSTSSESPSRSICDEKEEGDDIEVEMEGGDNGCLDDWEAVADALNPTNDAQDNSKSETKNAPLEPISGNVPRYDPSGPGILKKPDNVPFLRAWRPDDAFRPRTLPRLSKNISFPMNFELKGRKSTGWMNDTFLSQTSSCPICYEDLDLTDSSFLPCPCGFHLCLFCHKKILEDDGRCPGCRKHYSPTITVEPTVIGGGVPLTPQMPRSYSMRSRS